MGGLRPTLVPAPAQSLKQWVLSDVDNTTKGRRGSIRRFDGGISRGVWLLPRYNVPRNIWSSAGSLVTSAERRLSWPPLLPRAPRSSLMHDLRFSYLAVTRPQRSRCFIRRAQRPACSVAADKTRCCIDSRHVTSYTSDRQICASGFFAGKIPSTQGSLPSSCQVPSFVGCL